MYKKKKEYKFYSPNWRDYLKVVPFAVVYLLAHHLAFYFPDTENILMAIWPAGGIGLAALLLIPRRLWPITIAALFIAGNAANLSIGRPLFNSLGFMTANVLESFGCAWLIIRICGDKVRFKRIREIVALFLAAIFINAATACIGAWTASSAGIESFWTFWRTW